MLCGVPAGAQSGTTLLDPDPRIVQLSQQQNPGIAELADAAFIFSGTSAARRETAIVALDQLLQKAAMLSAAVPSQYERGEALMTLLHEEVLRTYHEQTSTLDAALIEGRYNCVSSSILFFLMARAAGLEVAGIVTTDHSFCLVTLDTGLVVDAETTNPYGWDPGTRKDFEDSKNQTAGFRYVPPGNYLARKPADGRALVALIAQNMATLQERRQQWDAALQSIVNAYAWLPSSDMYKVLAARMHNYTGNLVNKKLWHEAFDFMAAFASRHQLDQNLEALRSLILQGRLHDHVLQSPVPEAISAIKLAEQDGWLTANDRDELVTYAYGKVIESASRSKQWLEAWQLAREAVADWPLNLQLQAILDQARGNWTYSVHNEFALHYNARRFDQARVVLEAAAAIDPENSLIREDMELLRKAGSTGGKP